MCPKFKHQLIEALTSGEYEQADILPTETQDNWTVVGIMKLIRRREDSSPFTLEEFSLISNRCVRERPNCLPDEFYCEFTPFAEIATFIEENF